MHIPKAKWHDYPPSIEFESTDLPMEVVREFAKLALNHVNVRIRRGDVMSIVDSSVSESGGCVFELGPKAPMARVFGPDVVAYHNHQTALESRHSGLIKYAIHLAELSRRDEEG